MIAQCTPGCSEDATRSRANRSRCRACRATNATPACPGAVIHVCDAARVEVPSTNQKAASGRTGGGAPKLPKIQKATPRAWWRCLKAQACRSLKAPAAVAWFSVLLGSSFRAGLTTLVGILASCLLHKLFMFGQRARSDNERRRVATRSAIDSMPASRMSACLATRATGALACPCCVSTRVTLTFIAQGY